MVCDNVFFKFYRCHFPLKDIPIFNVLELKFLIKFRIVPYQQRVTWDITDFLWFVRLRAYILIKMEIHISIFVEHFLKVLI